MKKGFTLIEIMTAISIFIIVLTISMGAILGVTNSNRKTESLKAVMDNLNFSLESISREMRFGTSYHCGNSGTLTSPQNCPAGDTYVTFLSQGGQQLAYMLSGTSIIGSTDGGATWIPFTSPDVTITALNFYVLGANPVSLGDTQQPSVVIRIKGYAGNQPSATTNFAIQTLVSQRALDR